MSEASLAGCCVLVTRPEGQSEDLIRAIEDAGGDVLHFPVIKITGRSPETVASEFAALQSPDIVIFVSRNAVTHGLAALSGQTPKIAAIGPATVASLEAAGIDVDICPENGFTSEQLLDHTAFQDVDGLSIAIVRGESGREFLASALSERGARVAYVSAYRRELNPVTVEQVANLDDAWTKGLVDCVTVMSVETLRNLVELLPATSLERLRKTPLVAPGKRVIQTACELVPGIPAVRASGPGATDMLNALIEWRHSGQNP